ncbi:hypothetical protein Mal4_16950 [Maioricimonas rarisocia]|uniref:Uncharacterized protein n=1 Tax=Maioricimonas rarisocia TaxID=2528026 RepID=A0A517Z4H7_9PLAN|nr:hypothetical protein Mal4_16950 [Maioricimonas rarisocia]
MPTRLRREGMAPTNRPGGRRTVRVRLPESVEQGNCRPDTATGALYQADRNVCPTAVLRTERGESWKGEQESLVSSRCFARDACSSHGHPVALRSTDERSRQAEPDLRLPGPPVAAWRTAHRAVAPWRWALDSNGARAQDGRPSLPYRSEADRNVCPTAVLRTERGESWKGEQESLVSSRGFARDACSSHGHPVALRSTDERLRQAEPGLRLPGLPVAAWRTAHRASPLKVVWNDASGFAKPLSAQDIKVFVREDGPCSAQTCSIGLWTRPPSA